MTGRIDLRTFVTITATNAAKLYGLRPRKGTIAVGSDADLVLWGMPNERLTSPMPCCHDNGDYTLYEGRHIRSWPALTILRGLVVWCDGKVLGEPGQGQFLHRDLSPAVASKADRA